MARINSKFSICFYGATSILLIIMLVTTTMIEAFQQQHPTTMRSHHYLNYNSVCQHQNLLTSTLCLSAYNNRNHDTIQKIIRTRIMTSHNHHIQQRRLTETTTSLYGFLLPPDNNNDNNNKKSELFTIGSSILTVLATVAFFISPLGTIFFAIMNSFLALVILLPVIGYVSYQIWSYQNTITGNCPNCNASVTILKENKNNEVIENNFLMPVNVCYNCGTILEVKENKIYIANIKNKSNQPKSIFEEEFQNNAFDGWFRSSTSEGTDNTPSSSASTSLFDLFGMNNNNNDNQPQQTTEQSTTTTTKKTKASDTIIDVEIQKDDDDETSSWFNTNKKR